MQIVLTCHHLIIFAEEMLEEHKLTELQTVVYKIPFKSALK